MEGEDDESSVLAHQPQKNCSWGFFGALTFSNNIDRNQQVEKLSVPPAGLRGPLYAEQS